uniref:Small ribosomal subunit protein uS2c n=1 Tax=Pseudobryopsis hainanensis TaxID=2320808 RepID=A0A3S5WZZ2_9CHLO|nr:ribosomal protein S2 [Pseudobryopsis hainanensis]
MTLLQKLLDAGVHLGHPRRQWNPKMAPYIYTEKNGTHIIDLIQTAARLSACSKFLTQQVAQGKTVLLVGTKKQAARIVESVAREADIFFVNERWLGGLITNWKTLKQSIQRLKEFEECNSHSATFSKKEQARQRKQWARLNKYLGGVKNMKAPPDIVIIIGQPRELNAVRECQKENIRTVTLLDTDGDPSLADLFVPGNDDSIASLELVLNTLGAAIQRGQELYAASHQKDR